MKILRSGVDPETFLARVGGSDRSLLLLDYDGTLAPFRVERGEAAPYGGVRRRLARLAGPGGGTRLVIVSGRSIAGLLPLLALDAPPEVWGAHGRERLRPGGIVERAEPEEGLIETLAAARAWATADGQGDRLEEKPGGLALHVRGLPPAEREAILRRARARWEAIARGKPVEIRSFDGGIEARPAGRDKGAAVAALLAEERRAIPAAYLGDDETDEDAFRALEGRGLRVLVRETLRPTRADLWLEPPDDLLWFLDAWITAGERRRET